jgi:hypothetical protein
VTIAAATTDGGVAEDPMRLCVQAYYAVDPVWRAGSRVRWVMDLGWYKQIRAASEAYLDSDEKTDPDTWIPEPGDLLMAIPVDVREDGGEPHLERLPPTPAELAAAAERLRALRSTV